MAFRAVIFAAIICVIVYSVTNTLWYQSGFEDHIGTVNLRSGINVAGGKPTFMATERGQDLAKVHLPNRIHLGSELAAGRWPSREFIAAWETAAFYPVNWIYAAVPWSVGIAIELLTHFILAGAGVFVLARKLGSGRPGAAMAAILFATSGPLLARVWPGHLSNIATIAWCPWIFALTYGLMTDPRWNKSWFLSIALTLQVLSGHPQYIYYSWLMCAFFILVYCDKIRPVAVCMGLFAAAVAAIVTAPQILPAIDALRNSARLDAHVYFSRSFYLPYRELWTAIVPFPDGSIEAFSGEGNFWETTIFVGGAVGVVTAALGAARDRRLAVMILVPLLVALGVQTPLYEALREYLPLFGAFRGVGKFAVFYAMFAAVAAGQELEKLGRSTT